MTQITKLDVGIMSLILITIILSMSFIFHVNGFIHKICFTLFGLIVGSIFGFSWNMGTIEYLKRKKE